MATTDHKIDDQQNLNEKLSNNDLKVAASEYSGTTETNSNSTKPNNASVAENIVSDFNDDLDEHVTPAPAIKAIKRDINDSQGLSDDEFPKTLITLETVKKSAQEPPINEDDEICPIEADDEEFEEEPVLLEVVNEDGDDEHITLDKENGKIKDKIENGAQKEQKQHFTKTNDSKLNDGEPQQKNDKFITPIKPVPQPSAGTIEIPRDLIVSDLDVSTPIIINHIKNAAATTNSDDLIAILEGEDNGSEQNDSPIEHYELSMPHKKSNGEQKMALSREEERVIAMEQMMNLPKKKKGRPKLKESQKQPLRTKQIKKLHNDNLVHALVSDWDDNETRGDDSNEIETEIVVEINIPEKKKRKICEPIQPIQPTFRRSRIIKKKIIWDPDAPETAINYASLAHTSGAGPIKKPRKSICKKEPIIDDTPMVDEPTIDVIPTAPIVKKKKTSEIDKLLGDEGAVNMLNSLNQGNNNNNTDGMSPSKIPRVRQIKTEPCNVSNTTSAAITKPKPIKKDAKETIALKQSPPSINKAKNISPKCGAVGKKRGPKTASESWDYIFKSRPDDCMIIRRRSNSSDSSAASLNHIDDIDDDGEPRIKRSRTSKDKTKKSTKIDNDAKYQNVFEENVQKVFMNHQPLKECKNEDFIIDHVPIKLENGNDKFGQFEQIAIERFEHFAQIIFQSNHTNKKTFVTIQMLQEIETAFRLLEKDESCKLILFTSATESFCNGLDHSVLVQASAEKKRLNAIDLSKKLNNFMQTLSSYKKPLVACIKGDISGFGARILPLFDIVYAHVGTTFVKRPDEFTDAIEGVAVVSTTDKISYNAKVKLLFLNETFDVDEAKQHNIVSQVLNGTNMDVFEQRALVECEKLATESITTMETFRLIHQQDFLPKFKESLKTEQKQILNHWLKTDFIDKIKAYQNHA